MTTANNIASYAGSGIGTTATRFAAAAERPEDQARLTRALSLVSLVSSIVAVVALWFAAEPFARVLLRNVALTPLLRVAAFVSGGMVLLECCRGYFIGRRQYTALLVLALGFGLSIAIGLPWFATLGPDRMLQWQALVAISVCAAAGTYVLHHARGASAGVWGAAGEIWRFAFVQFAGIAGLNAAGWWIASLVARADPRMIEMGLFAASSQLRNMVALAPGLLTQSSFGMLAGGSSSATDDADHVLMLCSLGAFVSSTLIAGAGIVVLPWLLPAVYGASFHAGVLPGCFGLATAIVHMGSAPAAARLAGVSLKATAGVNATWSVAAVLLGTWLVPSGGSTAATGIYLFAHLLSSMLVLLALRNARPLPPGLVSLSSLANFTAFGLATLAAARAARPEAGLQLSAALVAVTAVSVGMQYRLARTHNWISAVRV